MKSKKSKAIKISVKELGQNTINSTNMPDQTKTVQAKSGMKKNEFKILEQLKIPELRIDHQMIINANKQYPSIRTLTFVEDAFTKNIQLIKGQLKKQQSILVQQMLDKFSIRCLDRLSKIKQNRLDSTVKQSIVYKAPERDQYEAHLAHNYSTQILQQITECKEKQRLKIYSKQKFAPQIQDVSKKIKELSQYVSMDTIKKQFSPIIDEVRRENDAFFDERQKQINRNLFWMIDKAILQNKEAQLKKDLKKMEQINRQKNFNEQMYQKYENLSALLFKPCHIFQ